MGMSIEEHIGVIEDLKSTMSVCMSEPEKTEICTSLSVASDTMRKYRHIQEIVKSWNDMNSFDSMKQISEVLEDDSN